MRNQLTRQRGPARHLGALATDAARKLNVLGHDGHALGVNRAEVRVFEQPDQMVLACLLQRLDRPALPAEVCVLTVLHLADNLPTQALER